MLMNSLLAKMRRHFTEPALSLCTVHTLRACKICIHFSTSPDTEEQAGVCFLDIFSFKASIIQSFTTNKSVRKHHYLPTDVEELKLPSPPSGVSSCFVCPLCIFVSFFSFQETGVRAFCSESLILWTCTNSNKVDNSSSMNHGNSKTFYFSPVGARLFLLFIESSKRRVFRGFFRTQSAAGL